MEYDFGLLKHVYDTTKFYPKKRYLMMTPLTARNYPEGFIADYEFRQALYRVKPILVANAPPDDEFIVDIDYHVKDYTEGELEVVRDIAERVADIVISILNADWDNVIYRFSGRGIHVVVKTGVVERAKRIAEEKHIEMNGDPRANLSTVVFREMQKVMERKALLRYLDRSNLSKNKVYRTPNSLNDKSFLPVVDFKPDEEMTLDRIFEKHYGEPRMFNVVFRRRVSVRVGETFKKVRTTILDEYEVLRQVITNNYYVRKVEEV